MACLRIISQDGTIDVPYEQVVIQRFKTEIYFLNKNLMGAEQLVSDMEIAKYSTEEKAENAMEILHEEYRKHIFGQGGAMATANFYVPPFAFIPPKVFQFPQDEDVEV